MTTGYLDPLIEFSTAGKEVNEDKYGYVEDTAWILDGATGHRDEPITNGETDGLWFVRRLDSAFRELRLEGVQSLEEIARGAINQVRSDFLEVAPEDLRPGLDVPAAAGAIIRREGDSVKYLILGDCTIIIEKAHTIATITDKRSAPIEQELIEGMQSAFETGISDPWDARSQNRELFLTSKAQVNTADGYWIFSLESNAIEKSLTGSFSIDRETTIHLLTDGFSCIQDTYRMYRDWSAVFNKIRDTGVELVVRQMRQLEGTDSDLKAFPRTKPSDDATVLSLTFP